MDRGFNGTAEIKRQITVSCDTVDSGDTCSGFTAVSHEDEAILVVFRGTTSTEQLVVEGAETVFGRQVSGDIRMGVKETDAQTENMKKFRNFFFQNFQKFFFLIFNFVEYSRN